MKRVETYELTHPVSSVRIVPLEPDKNPRMFAELDQIQDRLVAKSRGLGPQLSTFELQDLARKQIVVLSGGKDAILGVYLNHSTYLNREEGVQMARLKLEKLDEHKEAVLREAFALWHPRGDAPYKPLGKKG